MWQWHARVPSPSSSSPFTLVRYCSLGIREDPREVTLPSNLSASRLAAYLLAPQLAVRPGTEAASSMMAVSLFIKSFNQTPVEKLDHPSDLTTSLEGRVDSTFIVTVALSHIGNQSNRLRGNAPNSLRSTGQSASVWVPRVHDSQISYRSSTTVAFSKGIFAIYLELS